MYTCDTFKESSHCFISHVKTSTASGVFHISAAQKQIPVTVQSYVTNSSSIIPNFGQCKKDN